MPEQNVNGISDASESPESLLASAQSYLSAFPPDFESAIKIFDKAIKLYPEDADVLAACGELQSEIGDANIACELLEKSIRLDQKKDAARYFYLGQLQVGNAALQSFLSGIDLVKQEANGETNNEVAHQLCSAYCAISELYMTDLCDEDNAEAECLKHIDLALKANANSIEAHHCKAQYHKTIGELDIALREIKSCLRLLKETKVTSHPTIELRTNLSRTLIDLNETQAAIKLLAGCLEEDDQDIQVWYVLACAYLVEGRLNSAFDCAFKGEKILKSTDLWLDDECTLNIEIPALIEEINNRMQSNESEFVSS